MSVVYRWLVTFESACEMRLQFWRIKSLKPRLMNTSGRMSFAESATTGDPKDRSKTNIICNHESNQEELVLDTRKPLCLSSLSIIVVVVIVVITIPLTIHPFTHPPSLTHLPSPSTASAYTKNTPTTPYHISNHKSHDYAFPPMLLLPPPKTTPSSPTQEMNERMMA